MAEASDSTLSPLPSAPRENTYKKAGCSKTPTLPAPCSSVSQPLEQNVVPLCWSQALQATAHFHSSPYCPSQPAGKLTLGKSFAIAAFRALL